MKINDENNVIISPKNPRKREKYDEDLKILSPPYSIGDQVNEDNYLDSMKYLNNQALKLKDALHEKYYTSFDPKKINTNLSGKKLREFIISEQFHPKNLKVNTNILKEVRASRHTFYTSINRNKDYTPTNNKIKNYFATQSQFPRKEKL